MRCLLDTQVLLWWVEDDPRLQGPLRIVIAEPGNEVVVSAATLWKAAIKRALGKLSFETPVLLSALRRGGIRVLPITAEDALAAGDLPRHHDDPFDRMLVAQIPSSPAMRRCAPIRSASCKPGSAAGRGAPLC